MAEIVQQMNENVARDYVRKINNHGSAIWSLVTELHDQMGWKALGYKSWSECVKGEFTFSRAHAYRMIQAEKTMKAIEVSPTGDSSEPVPESVLREMNGLSAEETVAVWAEVALTHDGEMPTAKEIKEIIEKKRRPEPGPLDGLLASVREAIEQGEAFRELMNAITQIKGKVKRLVDSPLGRHINPNELNANLTNAFRILKFAMPFADCVYCGRTIKKTCKACGGEGWLVQDVFNQAPPDMKANSVVRKVG